MWEARWSVSRKDENGSFAYCSEFKESQTKGDSLEELKTKIKETIELYLETLPDDERKEYQSEEILTTMLEVQDS